MTHDPESFAHATLPSVGKRVLRIGLAGNYGIDERGVRRAAERGVNFWLWTPRFKQVTPVLRELLQKDRDAHVVSVLDNVALPGGPRRGVERARSLLGTEYLDCYKLGWLGRGSRFSQRIRDTMQALRDEGKVRSLGCSIHDRARAGELARASILDTLMIRYSAKHPGAEKDIFPHLSHKNPTIIAYTATAWGQLVKPLRDTSAVAPWPGAQPASGSVPPLTGPLCYRFCLTSPHVHVVLSGPKNVAQLDENLDALDAGPLGAEELAWVRDYGALVKSKRRTDYI